MLVLCGLGSINPILLLTASLFPVLLLIPTSLAAPPSSQMLLPVLALLGGGENQT